MASQQPIVEPGWKYEDAVESAIALEKLLVRHGVRIEPGSDFETRVLDVLRVPDLQSTGGLVPAGTDIREVFRNVVGVHELARLIVAAESSADFAQLLPHLRLLGNSSATQNAPSSARDEATNKLFELLVALLAMHCGTDLEVDDPIAATGRNPDILISAGGKRWGIACKVLHGATPKGVIDHLIKGIDQVEKSGAEIGVVAFNLKNIIPHDDLWPLESRAVRTTRGVQTLMVPKAFDPPGIPFQLLFAWAQRFAGSVRHEGPAGYLEGLFVGKKCVPVLLFWCHAVSGIIMGGNEKPASVRMMTSFSLSSIDARDRTFLECLNWAAFSDSPTRGPRPSV